MLRCIEQLVKGERESVGNHRCRSYSEGNHQKEDYIYHCTAICKVDHTTRKFTIDKGEYSEKMSTNRAVNDYRTYFQNLGYTESFDDLKDMLDYLVSVSFNQSIVVMYSKIDEPHRIVFSKDDNTIGEKIAVIHFETEDNGEVESFPFKGPQSLRKELAKLFKFYLDENFNG